MIIVTGASGFIGVYLVDRLVKDGFDVLATGRNKAAELYYKKMKIPFMRLDITKEEDFDRLPRNNIDAVIHLAALLPANVKNYNPYNYIDVNITGTLNVLEFCKNNNVKKIISATSYSDVQNSWAKNKHLDEKECRNFKFIGDHAMYVISKNTASDMIFHYSAEYKIKGIIFKLPPVYGYGPHSEIYVDGKYYKSGFQIFLEKATKGGNIEIFGDRNVSRDIVYVKDVINAFMLALKSQKANGLYNISSGISLTLDKQVKTMIKIFSPKGRVSKIRYLPEKKNRDKSYIFDISKAKKDFGYQPYYVPFEKLLLDYKNEMENKRLSFLVTRKEKD